MQAAALEYLSGQRLVDMRVTPETGATEFAFDFDTILHVRRYERLSNDELWSLFEPTGYVLSVYGDGTFSHEPGSGTDRRPRIERRPLVL